MQTFHCFCILVANLLMIIIIQRPDIQLSFLFSQEDTFSPCFRVDDLIILDREQVQLAVVLLLSIFYSFFRVQSLFFVALFFCNPKNDNISLSFLFFCFLLAGDLFFRTKDFRLIYRFKLSLENFGFIQFFLQITIILYAQMNRKGPNPKKQQKAHIKHNKKRQVNHRISYSLHFNTQHFQISKVQHFNYIECFYSIYYNSMNNKKAQNLDIQTNRTNNNQKAVFLQSKINKKYTPQMTSQEDMIKDQKILSTLIDFNSSYFQEKVKINQTRKPSKYRFKIPTRTGNSEYSKEYYKSIDSYNIQGAYPERKRIKSLIRLPNFYITRDSSYRKDYPQPIVKNPEQKYQTNLKTIKKRMLSLDGPFFADTSTYKQYAIKQIDDNVGMNKMSTLMLYGGKFKEATIYSKAYINKQQRPAELILPKNHSIFTQRKSHNVSNYKESYVDPSEQGTSSHLKTQEKLKTKSIPILANKRLQKLNTRILMWNSYPQKKDSSNAFPKCNQRLFFCPTQAKLEPILSHHPLISFITLIRFPHYQYIIKMSETKTSQKISDLVTPIAVTTEEMTYSNKVYLSTQGRIPVNKQFILIKGYILCAEYVDTIPRGKIGLNKKFREFLLLSLIDQTVIYAYDPKSTDKAVLSLHIKIEMLLPPKEKVQIDDYQVITLLKSKFTNYYLAVDQVFVINFQKNPIIVNIDKILGGDGANVFLNNNTKVQTFSSGQQNIRLKSTKNVKKNIFADNFTMQSLGIGGLDVQLTNLFRRAFASRRLPHSIIQKFGIKHVKGILLYGPPGTGKTLIARQLATTLKAKTLTVVNGPEVFSKFVGESEQNIRKLFLPAREDEKKYGDQSPIHVIVFDEIDAICRQRGSDGSGATSKDAVVNQLLTNLDGVQALNNIIVIGMTNRKDLIDQAVLRPGRLQVHIEIGIPSEQGRIQILKIHTKKLKEQKLLNKNVNIQEVGRIAKNYTGAELEAVVKNAASYAMTKGNNIMDFTKQLQIKEGTTVDQHDFIKALQEVIPGFGVDQQNLQVYLRNPLINYGKNYDNIMSMLDKLTKITLNGNRKLSSLLLFGPPGTGKSSIASHFAKESKFTYVKIIAPERYIGMGTYGRINSFNKIFNDSYKANESLIVIDNIERLIQYVQTGPDYNNTLMQALLVLIKKKPTNPNCKLMIIGTSSNYTALNLLDFDKVFNAKIKIPLLNRDECSSILGVDIGIENVGIKKLINFKEVCQEKPKTLWKNLWLKYS